MNKRNIHLPNENNDRNFREGNPLINQSRAKPKKEVLTRQQINKCLMDIEDTNPMKQATSIGQVAPILTKCFKQKNRKKDFSQSLKGVLMKELQVKIPKTEREVNEDPYLMLGYGMNAFFDV